MHTVFLTNPSSGRKGLGAQMGPWVEAAYADDLEGVKIVPIDFPNLDKQLDTLIAEDVKHIYAVGGDGTVNAIGAKLVGRPVNFGVIPTGSGNGFARNLGFSTKPKVALRQTREAKVIHVDTATINGVPFLNIAGVGITAEVANAYAHTSKRGLGPYVRESTKAFFAFQPQRYEVIIDGKKQVWEDMLAIEVANGTQWGYNAQAAPVASLLDGLLDVILVKRFHWYEMGPVIWKLFTGNFTKLKKVRTQHARDIRIQLTHPQAVQLDGEAAEPKSEVHIQVIPGSLRLLVPSTLTDEAMQAL